MDSPSQFHSIHNQQHHTHPNYNNNNNTNNNSRGGFRQASAVMNQLENPNYPLQNQNSFNNNGSNNSMPVMHRQEQEHHENVFSHHQQQQAPQYQHQSHYNARNIHQSSSNTTSSSHSSTSITTSSSTTNATTTSIAAITAVAAIAAASTAASNIPSSSNVPPLDLPPPSHNYQPQPYHQQPHHQPGSNEYPNRRNETQMQQINRQQIPPSPSIGPRNGQSYPVRSESASPHPQQQQQQSRYTPQSRSEYIPQTNYQQQQRPQPQRPQQTSTALVPTSSSSSAQYQPPPSPSQPIIRPGNTQNQRQLQAPSPSPDNAQNNQQQQQQMSAFVPATEISKKRRPPTSLDALHDDVRGSKGSALFPKSSGSTSTVFGTMSFHPQDISSISERLKTPLVVNDVMVRRGPGGKKLLYLSHEGAVNHANELFGWDGWSFEIIDFSEQVQRIEQDKFRVSVRLFGAVVLKNGMFKKDFGFGSSVGTHSDAWEMSYKTASSDCQKRCLRLFGSYLGNCLYNKDYHDELLEEKMKTNPKIL